VKIRYAACMDFTKPDPSTNNITEYEALLLGLCKMKALGHQNFTVRSDSKVISDHIEKESDTQNPEMINYLEAVREMEKHFNGFSVERIPRAQNNEANKLAKAAARKQPLPPDVFYEEIATSLIQQKKEKQINAIFSEDWRSPIMAYLRRHFEPTDETDEKRIAQRARGYSVSEGELYKSGVTAPWLKCIPIAQGKDLLNGIPSKLCGSHVGVRPLVAKAFRQGFFWPSALKDAEQTVRTCKA
jgi:ribonuclease HI